MRDQLGLTAHPENRVGIGAAARDIPKLLGASSLEVYLALRGRHTEHEGRIR